MLDMSRQVMRSRGEKKDDTQSNTPASALSVFSLSKRFVFKRRKAAHSSPPFQVQASLKTASCKGPLNIVYAQWVWRDDAEAISETRAQ